MIWPARTACEVPPADRIANWARMAAPINVS